MEKHTAKEDTYKPHAIMPGIRVLVARAGQPLPKGFEAPAESKPKKAAKSDKDRN